MSPLLSPEPPGAFGGGEVGGGGRAWPEAPPPSVLQNGWAFKRERLGCVWSAPSKGAMTLESPMELKDCPKGPVCDPRTEVIKERIGEETPDPSPPLPISKSVQSHFSNSKTK